MINKIKIQRYFIKLKKDLFKETAKNMINYS